MRCYNYDTLIKKAEHGDTHSMIQAAKLARANDDEIDYIFWLEQFMDSPEVRAVVNELEADHSAEGMRAETRLKEDVIEAMCCLFLYYRFYPEERAQYIPEWFSLGLLPETNE